MSPARATGAKPAARPFLLQFGDGLAGVETLRAHLRAIQDGVAAVDAEGVFQIVEAFAGRFVAAIGNPAMRLQQGGRAEKPVAVPPIGWAASGAAGAEYALVKPVQLLAVFTRLAPFLFRRGAFGLQPWLDGAMLGEEIGEIGHQVFRDRHMRQRVDFHDAANILDRLCASQRVGAVNIHRAGAANPLTAGAAERQGRIDLVLDLDDRVQDHRTGVLQIEEIGVHMRIGAVVGRPAIDAEFLPALLAVARRLVPGLTFGDLRILGECELNHMPIPLAC